MKQEKEGKTWQDEKTRDKKKEGGGEEWTEMELNSVMAFISISNGSLRRLVKGEFSEQQ